MRIWFIYLTNNILKMKNIDILCNIACFILLEKGAFRVHDWNVGSTKTNKTGTNHYKTENSDKKLFWFKKSNWFEVSFPLGTL